LDVLQKEDDEWVKRCMKYEVEGSRPRGRPKRNRTRGCGKRPPSTQIKHRGCYGSLYTEEVDKEWLMIRVDVNG